MRQTRQGLTTPEDHRSAEASSSSFWFLPGGGCFSCLCIPIRRQQQQQHQRQPSPALSLTTVSPNTIAATSMVQMFYYENRGKCCKKLLRYNGYPSKVRIMKVRHVLPAMYSLLHVACLVCYHRISFTRNSSQTEWAVAYKQPCRRVVFCCMVITRLGRKWNRKLCCEW
jgi:hypothetical protein